jgi:hypothetical protein
VRIAGEGIYTVSRFLATRLVAATVTIVSAVVAIHVVVLVR